MRHGGFGSIGLIVLIAITAHAADDVPRFEHDIAPLFKQHCVKCHGPLKQEGKLNLAVPGLLVRGGKSGPAVVPHDTGASLIWRRVSVDEMPPETPLSAAEKSLLQRWIIAGKPGLKRDVGADDADHWAFRKLRFVPQPFVEQLVINDRSASHSPLDDFLIADLKRDGLTIAAQADRATLIRRVSFDLTGLPPDVEAITEFQADPRPDAYGCMVDRYMASPHFGERLGKMWLDAAGYADSNGYFSADSDRPLAYRYRDYVIRAINDDRPFDQFVREQIAGDEISGVSAKNGETADFSQATQLDSLRQIELLEATHYLRCGQDGSGESDGKPDEVRVDRYTVLETAIQNVSTGLLGLTIQCAKCHDHKFEPMTQRDYYRFQSVLIPAFPPEQWVNPNDRFVYASRPGEFEAWQAAVAGVDADLNRLSNEITEWVKQHRPRGKILFSDAFDAKPEALSMKWSNTAPGDLDDRMHGPYIATSRTGAGETIVPEDNPGSRRRSIYLQQ